MASPQAGQAKRPAYSPPTVNGDFYKIGNVLNERERALIKRVRKFAEEAVAPVIEDYWARDAFPFEIIPKMAEVGIGGVGYQGYGAAGGSWLLNGFVAMELARINSSVATFWGVHTGLSAGSVYLCGDEEQKQRWLPAMMRFETIGSFGLTEPMVGSATSGGMMTMCRREGDSWILNGQKKWIGNSTFADINVIWAREEELWSGQGFRRAQEQSRVLGRKNQKQNGFAGGPERTDHPKGLPRVGGRPVTECKYLQGYGEGPPDDPHRGRLVCCGLPDGRL